MNPFSRMMSLVNRYALFHARRHGFSFVRSDRGGAMEFVATRRTGRDHWYDGDGEVFLAYTIADAIFYPSRRAMRNARLVRHELCHVRQGRRLGHAAFWIAYWWETLRRGYWWNRFERAARRAERRTPRSRTRGPRSG